MQQELEELQPQLVTASAENERMMIIIEKESKEVEYTSKVRLLTSVGDCIGGKRRNDDHYREGIERSGIHIKGEAVNLG